MIENILQFVKKKLCTVNFFLPKLGTVGTVVGQMVEQEEAGSSYFWYFSCGGEIIGAKDMEFGMFEGIHALQLLQQQC